MTRSTFIRHALRASLLLAATAVFGRAQPGQPPDIARIAAAGELRIAMVSDLWPPFFYLNKRQQLAGLDIDLANEIARRLSVRVRFVREARTFDEVVTMIVDRRADIAAAYLSDTLHRAKLVRFTRPYMQVKPAVLINRALAGTARRGRDHLSILNHPSARIGVTKGSSAAMFAAADYPLAQIVSYDAWAEITRDVAEEKLTGAVCDEIDGKNWQTNHPEGAIAVETIIRPGPPDTLGIAVHREDRHLLYWLNHFLTLKERDGSLHRLRAQYIENNLWKRDLP